jgi:hypothetical protein
MTWQDIPWQPSRSMLRQFAGLWLAFFALTACWQGWMHERWTLALVCALLAATVGPLGLLRPTAVRPIFVGWMVLAFPIGWLVARIILTALFFGLFTPIAWVFRLAGRDVLQRRLQPELKSYWTTRAEVSDVRRYFRQF